MISLMPSRQFYHYVRFESSGFSLVECLCVIAIISVLSGLVGQFFFSMRSFYALQQAKVLLKDALVQVRLQAMHDRAVRCLCVSDDHQQCRVDWRGAHLMVGDASGARITGLPWLDSVSLQWKGNLAHNARLCFKPSGFTQGQQGHFILGLGHHASCLWVGYRGNVFERVMT